MTRYIVRRLLGLIPVLWGITVISFFVIHLAPGKPTDQSIAMNPRISTEARMRIERIYGLDRPVTVQYFAWLKRFAVFDFGESYVDGRKVSAKIVERLPVTLAINTLSLAVIFAFGIPLGVWGAVRHGRRSETMATVAAFVSFSLPEFWVALLAMEIFCIWLGILPVSGIVSLDFEYLGLSQKCLDILRHLVLPVTVASFAGVAGISRYMKMSVSGVLSMDYVRAARAKGLTERAVIVSHVLRNALLPVVTIAGLSVPGLIGGSVIFESIFSIPGMGRLFYDSVMSRDYTTIMGILTIGAILTLAGNLMADIAYSAIDPRIRCARRAE